MHPHAVMIVEEIVLGLVKWFPLISHDLELFKHASVYNNAVVIVE